jgi:hypothetical protein
VNSFLPVALRGRDAGNALRRVDQAVVPERGTGIVGIERIDAIVPGRDKNDVVNSLPGDRDIRHVEGLSGDRAIDYIGKLLAEVCRVDV